MRLKNGTDVMTKIIWLFGIVVLATLAAVAQARVSSPGNVTFANTNALNTGVTFSSSGTYVLQLMATDGMRTSTSTVTIVVNAPVTLPDVTCSTAAAIAGTSFDIPVVFTPGSTGVSSLQFDLVLPAGISSNTVIAGIAATTAGKTVSSNLIGNSLRVIIAGLNQNAITAGSLASLNLRLAASLPAGVVPLNITNLTASDANGNAVSCTPTNGSVTVTANQAPAVNAGPNQTITLPASAALAGTASDDGAPNPPGSLTFSWSIL